MEKLEQTIGYEFSDKNLFKRALVHSSYANEEGTKSNERLEFLGDSILSLVISDFLYLNFSDLPEGDLTRLRSLLVCENSLYEQALKINLGKAMFFGKGEEKAGGRSRKSILADAFEALIAAIYLDGGYEFAEKFILRSMAKELEGRARESFKDFKSELQEFAQSNFDDKIYYRLSYESGPDHQKEFGIDVYLGDKKIGFGSGTTKKSAEQEAAREALISLAQ